MTEHMTEQWYEKHFGGIKMTEQEKQELHERIERWYDACLDGRVRSEDDERLQKAD